MHANDILTPAVLFPDRIACASLDGTARNHHWFGGPLELDLEGWSKSTPRPQRVVTLRTGLGALALETEYPCAIPLLYAFRLSGCTMRYQIKDNRTVKFLEVTGRALKDWPYEEYPSTLPTRPLYFARPKTINLKKLEKDERWHGITHQDSRPREDEILVIVPPNDWYGVSLWGRWGDGEQVQTVFRVNLKTLLVEAWNECT